MRTRRVTAVGVVGVVAVWSSWPTVSVTSNGLTFVPLDVLVEHDAVLRRVGHGLVDVCLIAFGS